MAHTPENACRPQHEGVFRIGCQEESDVFSLVICIEKVNGLQQLAPSDDTSSTNSVPTFFDAWLSYKYLDNVVQTDKFDLYHQSETFVPIADGFRLRASITELAEFFSVAKNGSLEIFLCSEGCILGSTRVSLQQLLSLDGEENFAERTGKGEFHIIRYEDSNSHESLAATCPPTLSISASLQKEGNAQEVIESSTTVSSQTSPKPKKLTSACTTGTCKPLPPQDPTNGTREADASTTAEASNSSTATENTLAEERIKFEQERRNWEQWKHKEEILWHQRMREQEIAAIKALEDQSKAQEKERDKAAEISRQEFVKLESRLRKALSEVEKRERRIRTLEASREAEFTTKMAEVQLKERLVKEESKHAADLERAKLKAANDRVLAAEKATAAAEEKIQRIEYSFEEFKKRHRETSEAALQQEIVKLKGELATSESRINQVVKEKNEAMFEKEQQRINVHRLAKALQKQKQRADALEEKDRGQLRLDYATNQKKGQGLAIGGNRQELRRICNTLTGMTNEDKCKNKNNRTDNGASNQSATNVVASHSQNTTSHCQNATELSLSNACSTASGVPSPLTPPRHPQSARKAGDENRNKMLLHSLGQEPFARTPPVMTQWAKRDSIRQSYSV